MPGWKVAVLVPDGAADLPLEIINEKTPLEVARTPNMDEIARTGATGTLRTVPQGMSPGSDVANLSLLGYDPESLYGGRGPVEAANLGLEVPPGWTAFRCNIVSTDRVRMLDYSGGHIGQEDAGEIIRALGEGLGDGETRFHEGKSYRHILMMKGEYQALECTPPHDITGERLDEHMPAGRGAQRVRGLMERSRKVLDGLAVNERLAASGRPVVDMIWPWGQGEGVTLEPFERRFGLSGAVISAVDLVCGLGRLAGLRTVSVPGMTGFLDTNYLGQGEAAVRVLARDDFVYVHVEAPDEASHMGDAGEKVLAIERFDSMVVGPVLRYLPGAGDDYRVLVCPDHLTLISTRTHDGSPVPYALSGTGIPRSGAGAYCEEEARKGDVHLERGWKMMSYLAGMEPWGQA
ncbi:MAG: cofactor-independent phosphoglycerate mutase [Actinobacteria bacterium]|nr:cofactor-independent phosphoglycerate mutase [Actinomycetota bacterium]